MSTRTVTAVHCYKESLAWAQQVPDLYVYDSGDGDLFVPIKHAANVAGMRGGVQVPPRVAQMIQGLRSSHNGHGIADFLNRSVENVTILRALREVLDEILSPLEQEVNPLGRQIPPHATLRRIENSPNACEGAGWITHILENYENLGCPVRFLQGHPFDHVNERLHELLDIPPAASGYRALSSQVIQQSEHSRDSDTLKTALKGLSEVAGSDFKFRPWGTGAQSIVTPEAIRRLPRETWQRVFDWALETPMSGHALERGWSGLFLYGQP